MEAIYRGTFNLIKFPDDLDNSDEDDLSDEEMVSKIKERKAQQRAMRTHVGIVRKAAADTMQNVDKVRKSITVDSIIERSLNM